MFSRNDKLGRPAKTLWEDLIRQHNECKRAYDSARPYIALSRQIMAQLSPENQQHLQRIMAALLSDLQQMDAQLNDIASGHTNSLGHPYTGDVRTDGAEAKYLEISTRYISWHENLTALIMQPIADIDALSATNNPEVPQHG